MCDQSCDHPSQLLQSRRQFLGVGLGFLAATAFAPWKAFADAAPPQNAISPDTALRRLLEGNARHAAGKLYSRDFSASRAARAKGQYPIAAILGCADSRVAPEVVFDQGLGDLFVVRVAGNYLDNDNLASLEYAVAVLKVPLVMVLGHTECGAVKAAIDEIKQPAPLPGHIWDIADAVRPGIINVVKAGGGNMLFDAIRANVDYNVSRIASAQPIVSEAVQSGSVKVTGAVYDLATGKALMHQAA
jgi:carbonic anhydrase